MDKIQAMDNMPRPSSLRKLHCDSKDIFWDPWDLLTTHNMAAFSSVDILAVLRNLRKCDLCNLLHRGTLRRENKPASKPRG
ncbi:unnamed protein product [Lepeophtheirus salmonis]|uniref:(salmon louse) hypothetical protein n=1 Tax=Lepeophtheirus salmonis TaxID=72036 RepID=A0A7R8D835_LEPSM|nr:unnamed protein product [Lepeophtheirus salmonis]CAF3030769.1 unnamed protein product [Lepeophtheirus salmonis]